MQDNTQTSYSVIEQKIHAFIKRYYFNTVLRGFIIFMAFGVLLSLFVALLEGFFWFSTLGRKALFYAFIITLFVFVVIFVVIPLLRYFNVLSQLKKEDAAKKIGDFFPEVRDKLLNTIQLLNEEKTELVAASIEQKSEDLKQIPFTKAIDFRQSVKHFRLFVVPILVYAMVIVFSGSKVLASGYKRVTHYRQVYKKPQPFYFQIVNQNLSVIQTKNFILKVKISGDKIPEEVYIDYGNQHYLMSKQDRDSFFYTFDSVEENINFQLFAGGINSENYTIKVLCPPIISKLKMVAHYHSYTHKPSEIFEANGNAVVPKGTKITWIVEAQQTDSIYLFGANTKKAFLKQSPKTFVLSRSLYKDFPYEISTVNTMFKNYEHLRFKIAIQNDSYPELRIEEKKDSLAKGRFFTGIAQDDYGIKALKVIYFLEKNQNHKTEKVLKLDRSSKIQTFTFRFPKDIILEKGEKYAFYFEVWDNDEVQGSKSTKSKVYNYTSPSELQEQKQELDKTKATFENLKQFLATKPKEKDDKIAILLKKNSNYWNLEKKRLEERIKLLENLKDVFKDDEPSAEQSQLKKNVERAISKIKENQEQLKKFEQLQRENRLSENEINKLKKETKIDNKNTQLLLENTKRFYIKRNLDDIQKAFESLSKEQHEAIKNTELQQVINTKTSAQIEKLKQTIKLNQDLYRPVKIEFDLELNARLEANQKNALEKNGQEVAKEYKKNASKDLHEMSQNLKEDSERANGKELKEDRKNLRKVLDNLLAFSFDEETTLGLAIGKTKKQSYQELLKKQKALIEVFNYIDDSLFSLSLRRPEFSEKINTNIEEVYYSIEKSIERFSDNNYNGVIDVQKAMVYTNELSDILSNMLDNIDVKLKNNDGSGGSPENETQLQDLVQKQQQIKDQIEKQIGKQQTQKEEERAEENYKIYKEQEELRNKLEDAMKTLEGKQKDNTVKDAENLEKLLIEKGATKKALQDAQKLIYNLITLDKAKQEKDKEEQKRQSKTGKDTPQNTADEQTPKPTNQSRTEALIKCPILLNDEYDKPLKRYFQ